MKIHPIAIFAPLSLHAPIVRLIAPIVLWMGICLLAVGCKKGRQAPPTPPPPVVTVAHALDYPVQSYFEYNGYLDAIDFVQIKARVKGNLEKVHFVDGMEVAKDALLYTIDPREYEAAVAKAEADKEKAEADIENGKAQILLGETDLARIKLSGAAIASGERDKAVATLATNKAQLKTAAASKHSAEAALDNAKLELGYTQIRAPIAGQISRTLITAGNLVGQNETTLLTTIVRMDKLYIYFDAPERDLVEYQHEMAMQPGTTSAIDETAVEVGVATEIGYPHTGKLDFRENRVDTGTGTVRVRGRIDNPTTGAKKSRLLYPGLFSRVRIPAGSITNRPVIPEEALMTGQEGRYVYVIGEGNAAEKRTVKVGPQVWAKPAKDTDPGPRWELIDSKGSDPKANKMGNSVRSVVAILDGLKPGDRVIVNGLQRVRPGAPVSPDDWEFKRPASAKN